MDSAYAARYRELYERHWWWRARERLLVRTLRDAAPSGGFGRILDVGCGDGLFFDQLRAFGEPEGLDVDAALITDTGRSRGRIHIGPLDEAFQPEYRFGLITLLDVLEHLEDPGAALARARQLLTPGGTILLTVPAFRWLWTVHDTFNHHKTRYTRGELRQQVAAHGFVEVRSHYFFHWLVIAKLAVRFKEALAGESGPASIPSPPVNRALLALCRLEQALLGRIPPPMGSSLLYIGVTPGGAKDPSASNCESRTNKSPLPGG
jgi:SAM-dependent methyltransferase